METAESAPVRHYYRKLPGGELAREKDGVRVKCSFSGELGRPARCKMGAKIQKRKTLSRIKEQQQQQQKHLYTHYHLN